MQRESGDTNGLLARTLQAVSFLRSLALNPKMDSRRWDVVLLGAVHLLSSGNASG
jgi:hypothetical protein